MANKTYLLLAGAGIIAIFLFGFVYLVSEVQKPGVGPAAEETKLEQEILSEEEILSEDINDIEEFNEDTDLDDVEQYLLMLSEGETISLEGIGVALVLVEDLEKELSLELNSFSNDFSDLEEFNKDASLNNLETELIGIRQ